MRGLGYQRSRPHDIGRLFGAGLALLLAAIVPPADAAELTFVRALRNGDGVSAMAAPSAVVVSGDGAYAYVAGGIDNSVVVLARDATTGQLTFVDFVQQGVGGVDGLSSPFGLAISPDGASVYATSFNDHAVSAFDRDPATGLLSFIEVERDGVGGVSGLGGATPIAISPDGASVYAGGFVVSALAVFARDPLTGGLTFLEAHMDGVAGVDGLDRIRGVAVSPDGANVYALGRFDNAMARFSRDPSTGRLTFQQVHRDGVGGVDCLAFPYSVAVSPDGAHVYTSSYGDHGIAAWTRDAGSGALAFLQCLQNGSAGVSGLEWPYHLGIRPDGLRLYAAAYEGNGIVAFSRDPASGLLSYAETHRDGVAGVDGLDFAIALAVSPSGTDLYGAGYGDHAIAHFAIAPAAACPAAPRPGCAGVDRSVLRWRSGAGGNDTLVWRWRGPFAPGSSVGDPLAATGYAFCIYAAGGVILAAEIGAGPPWQAVGTRGFRYTDLTGAADGITRLVLLDGDDRATVSLQGRGAGLDDLPPVPLPLLVQLARRDGADCWESPFVQDDVRRNGDGRLTARRR